MSTNSPSPTGDTGSQLLQQTQTPSDPSAGTTELAAAVDELLDQLQHKFDGVSSEIFGKLDDMSRRLDELEASISSAQEDAGVTKG